MSKELYIDSALAWAKRSGLKNIRIDLEGYESPASFSRAEEDGFTPDITGTQIGGKSYVEIALKDGDLQELITKWKLLSTMANMKGGKFFLLAPRGHKAFAERLVEQHSLKAQVIYLQ